jgi:integrase/recombinase XerD
MKLKHVDLEAGCVYQDARDVRTKFSKTFTTYFFPVSEDFLRIVRDWVLFLRSEKRWSGEDPLFPATQVTVGIDHRFAPAGLKRAHWSTAAPIREVFGKAFRASGLPYFNPHSFRNTLVKMGQTLCRTPEEYKAWSQNLGHEGVLTTFRSYGAVSSDRQAQIILSLAEGGSVPEEKAAEITKAVLRALRS